MPRKLYTELKSSSQYADYFLIIRWMVSFFLSAITFYLQFYEESKITLYVNKIKKFFMIIFWFLTHALLIFINTKIDVIEG